MIISKYGVELHRVTHDDIELIRQMRNRDDIRTNMFEQAIITPEQQEAWFSSINNEKNYYFILHYGQTKRGIVYGKNMNFERRECEGGVFIWDFDVRGTDIPAKASICLIELAFNILLTRQVYARVRPDNSKAIYYNKALGFRPALQKTSDYMMLTRADYEERFAYLRKIAGKNDMAPLSAKDISIHRDDKNAFLYDRLPRDVLALLEPCFS